MSQHEVSKLSRQQAIRSLVSVRVLMDALQRGSIWDPIWLGQCQASTYLYILAVRPSSALTIRDDWQALVVFRKVAAHWSS